MKKIVSFGDSFIYGTELTNEGSGAWPGLIAQRLGVEYETCAVPGCGNENITRQILSYYSKNSKDTLAVVNWTWAMRWDFYLTTTECWVTLGPTCVPQKLEQHLPPNEAERVLGLYRDYTSHSILWDRFRSLQTIYAAQQYLKSQGIPTIHTYMDYNLFGTEFHAPDYIRELQNSILPEMQNFGSQNFLDWSKSRGYTVTDPGWHPLEEAHEAAADFWLDKYKDYA